jgi:signal peptidase II
MRFCSTGLRWLWISVIVIAFDRITKMVAQKYLVFHEALAVMPSLNFTLSYNRGSAFSFLDTAQGWQVWMFAGVAIIVSVGILVWLYRIAATQKWLGVALAFIVGGALGNLWDRFSYGHVIDFIDVYAGRFHWPVFNIADSAICVGAVMLFCDAIFRKS